MDFAQAVRVNLAKMNKSQNWLAREIGVTQGALSHYMAGARPWKESVMVAVASKLNKKLSTLIKEAEEAGK